MEILGAEMKCFCDSSTDYTHLLCDTDGNDRAAGEPRGQWALSSAATWQHLQSCSKEVSLLICVSEATTQHGPATRRTQSIYSRVSLSRCMPSFPCAYLEIQTLQPWFFNQPDHTLLCAEMLKLWVHTRLEASLWSFPQIRWWWPLKSGFMNWEKHQIRERGGGRILQCFISSNIFQGWYSPFFFFFSMELPLWNAERGEINEYCFLVPSTWQNKIICTEGTRALASSPQEPSISFIQGILFSAKRDPLII